MRARLLSRSRCLATGVSAVSVSPRSRTTYLVYVAVSLRRHLHPPSPTTYDTPLPLTSFRGSQMALFYFLAQKNVCIVGVIDVLFVHPELSVPLKMVLLLAWFSGCLVLFLP